MARITEMAFRQALRKRYKDIRDELRLVVVIDGIDHDNKRIKQMKSIAALAQQFDDDVKE